MELYGIVTNICERNGISLQELVNKFQAALSHSCVLELIRQLLEVTSVTNNKLKNEPFDYAKLIT